MYRFVSDVKENVHDEFIKKQPLCNLLQSSSWAKVKDNWKHRIVGVYDDNTLIASALVLIKPLPLGYTMMYTPRGPIMDYENARLVTFFFEQLKKWAKPYKCLFVKCDPAIAYKDYKIGESVSPYENCNSIMQNMKHAGLLHKGFTTYIEESIQPRYQANVYRCDDFDESLPRHTKRLIKDALKRDVQVVKAGIDRIQEFSDVVALTEARKNVNLRNHEYFMQLMEIYKEDAYLFLAQVNVEETLVRLLKQQAENNAQIQALGDNSPKKQRRLNDIKISLEKDIKEFESFAKEYEKNTVIAGILSIKFGDTMEMLYAGMNDSFKKFMPQYYLYTENMKYAFAHGCNYANMGGVEGDLKDGLTKFKSNFNPYINEFIGEFDLPVNSLLYKASELAYTLRKRKSNKK